MLDEFTNQLAQSNTDLFHISGTWGRHYHLVLEQWWQIFQQTLQHTPVRLLWTTSMLEWHSVEFILLFVSMGILPEIKT